MDKNPQDISEEKRTAKAETKNTFSTLSIAWELGYMIAIPLVALTLGGRFLDKKFDTSPLFLLVGVVVSIIFSTYAIWRKMSDIIEKTK